MLAQAPPRTAAEPVVPRLPTGHAAPLAVLLFVCLVALVGYRVVANLHVPGQPHLPRWGQADFRDAVYYPVRAFLAGDNPYDARRYMGAYPAGFAFPLYLPATLLLHLPFGLLPFGAAELAYYLTMVGLLPVLALLTLALSGVRATIPRVFGLAALLLASRPGHWSVFIGQYTVTVVVGAYLALLYARRRPWLAALGLAVALIKPTFGAPLAALMLARRDVRPVLLGLAVATAVSALPAAVLAHRAGGLEPFLASLGESHRAFEAETSVDPASSPFRVDVVGLAGRLLGRGLGDGAELALGLALLALGCLGVRRLSWLGEDAARLGASLGCVVMLACTYHQAYDGLVLALPLTALAVGRWAPAGWASARVRWLVFGLLALPVVNYLASGTAIASLGIGGGWWVAVTSLNGVALLGALSIHAWVAFRHA
jgi:hypothetical protein